MKQNSFNIPNILTILRLLSIPFVIYFIIEDNMTVALVVFLAAVLTDLADGYIARKFNLITKLGMWLDPFADKLMAVSVLVAFTINSVVPLYITLIIFVKEFLMLLGGLLIIRKGIDIPSDTFGKASAFLLNFTIALGFLSRTWVLGYSILLHAATVAMLVAFVHYAVKNGKHILQKQDI